jgi:hypothetical protein
MIFRSYFCVVLRSELRATPCGPHLNLIVYQQHCLPVIPAFDPGSVRASVTEKPYRFEPW